MLLGVQEKQKVVKSKKPKRLLWLTMVWAGGWTRWSPEVPSILSGSVTVILQILNSSYIYVQIIFLNKYFFFCRKNCDS